jgi:methylenetetrahydrofolate reductase (NADPH)
MKITEILKKKRTFSFEFFPPKDEKQSSDFFENLKELALLNPDFVSVTDTNYGIAKYKHLALSKLLMEKLNFNVILHLTCINNTRKELIEFLNKAIEFKIENILALRGDYSFSCDINARDFSYAIDLLPIINKDFFSIGAAAHPESHPESSGLDEDIEFMKRKIDAGVSFFITQVVFDNEALYRFMEKMRKNNINAPLIVGIMPVSNYKMIENIEKKTGHISKPKEFLHIVENYKDKKEEFYKYSLDFFTAQCEDLLSKGVNALHFFTFNKAKMPKEILKRLK